MPLVTAAISGFLLGASLIIAIGAQNAFILRQGLLRQHVFVLSLICALSDALLIAAGVAGLGALISASPRLISAGDDRRRDLLARPMRVLALRRAFRPAGADGRAARRGQPQARRSPLASPSPSSTRMSISTRCCWSARCRPAIRRCPHRLWRGRGTCIVRVVFRAGLRRPAASAGLCQTGGVARARPHDRCRDDRDRDRAARLKYGLGRLAGDCRVLRFLWCAAALQRVRPGRWRGIGRRAARIVPVLGLIAS